MPDFTIRPWCETDDAEALTDLLHRAYRPLADAGMHFVASHQDSATTLKRIARGRGFLAINGSRFLGTIVYYPPGSSNGCDWYRRPGVATFGQFAVEPGLQRQGIGTSLIDHVTSLALADGASELALDTSEHAHGLIAYYRRLGFREVARTRWPEVNYESLILSRPFP